MIYSSGCQLISQRFVCKLLDFHLPKITDLNTNSELIRKEEINGCKPGARTKSHHFMQSVEFAVAFLDRVLSAVHQHVNPEDLKERETVSMTLGKKERILLLRIS